MSFPQVTGYYGMTVNGFDGLTDTHGQVSRVIFAIHYPYQRNDVEFTISNGATDFAARFSDNSTVNIRNPKILYTHKNAAAVSFEMEEPFPANSPCYLVYRSENAWININDLGSERPFAQNSISGFFGYTVDGHGGPDPDSNGDVLRVLFSISFPHMRANVEFVMSDDPNHWTALMPDGTLIPLRNPLVLHTTRDSATVQFEMSSKYPSNSPAALIYASSDAWFNINEVEEETPFIPLEKIKGIPLTVTAGIAANLTLAATFVPVNATMQTIKWSVVSGGGTGAAINAGGVLTTSTTGNIVIRATIENGAGAGDYVQDFTISVVANVITIISQPDTLVNVVPGAITAKISTMAQVTVGVLNYQWYSNTTNSNVGGSVIPGATNSVFNIPTSLLRGDYYYFCEIKASGAASVRTNVTTVKARPLLTGIEISPRTSTLALGTSRTLSVNMIPTTADPIPVTWASSNPSIVSVNSSGELFAHNDGTVTITATSSDGIHKDTISITVAAFVSVTNISGIPSEIETWADISLNPTVTPANATNRSVSWSVINAESTGASITGNILKANAIGQIVIRATIVNGASQSLNYIQDFTLSVILGHKPVENITIGTLPSEIRVNDQIILSGTVSPSDASYKLIEWSLATGSDKGNISGGNILTLTGSGNVVIRATVKNGLTKTTNYTKDFPIQVLPAWVPIESIQNLPATWEDYDHPLVLSGSVLPANASKTIITYEIIAASNDLGIILSGGNSLVLNNPGDKEWYTLNPNPVNIPFDVWIPIERTLMLKIKIVDGMGPGKNYEIEHGIYLKPPAAPFVFIPVTGIEMEVPSILRAWRPVVLDKATIVPWNSTNKMLSWNKDREDVGGADSVIFQPEGDNMFWRNIGVQFLPDYDYDIRIHRTGPDGEIQSVTPNYLYSFDPGEILINARVHRGLANDTAAGADDGVDYSEDYKLNFLPPFIPVKAINDIPLKIPRNTLIHLCPEVSVSGGTGHRTPTWDDDLPSYDNIEWSIMQANGTGVTVTNDGILKATELGTFNLRAYIPQGVREAHTWYDLVFNRIAFSTGWMIDVVEEEEDFSYPLMTLTLVGGKDIEAYRLSDIALCSSNLPPETSLTINGETFRKEQVKSIKFWEVPELPPPTDIIVNGVILDEEGEPVEGAQILFNPEEGVSIEVPSEEEGKFDCVLETAGTYIVTIKYPMDEESEDDPADYEVSYEITLEEGDIVELIISPTEMTPVVTRPPVEYMDPPPVTSLLNFGRNFTKLIEIDRIPETVNGPSCLRNFLRGCTSFNKDLVIPDGVTGERCLESFLRDCTSFNSTITLHEGVTGDRCMAEFLYGCIVYNQPITLPESVIGYRCLYRFMMKCNAFNKPIALPNDIGGDFCLMMFMQDCFVFNQALTIPDSIRGEANFMNAFHNCHLMTSPVTISLQAAENTFGNPLTFASYIRGSATSTTGIPIVGTGAALFKTKHPSTDEYLPHRLLK